MDVSDPTMTVTGLMAMLEEQYGVELSMLSSGVTILYSDFLDRKKMQVGELHLMMGFIVFMKYFLGLNVISL